MVRNLMSSATERIEEGMPAWEEAEAGILHSVSHTVSLISVWFPPPAPLQWGVKNLAKWLVTKALG